MADRLAELLVNEGAVTTADLERALARQRQAGGALDTALLELGLVSEERLGELLCSASELPPAPADAWRGADVRSRRVFPSKVAERHGLVPFALDGRELSLLAAYPVDAALLDELGFMLSLHLDPHVAPEWRVRELVGKVYGTPVAERYVLLAQKLRGGAAPPEPVPEPPPEPVVTPAPVVVPALRGFSRDDAEPSEPLAVALAQAVEKTELSELLQPQAPSAPTEIDRSAPPRWNLEEAQAALAAARGRDDVVVAVLRYTRDFFEYASLFAVTYDAVAGHDALSATDEGAREQCRMLAVSLSEPALFRAVLEARAPYLGPPPRDTGSDAVLRSLRREAPRTVLLYPVILRGHIVCILFADNGEAPVSPRRLGDLLIVLSRAGATFERILRERKRERAAAPAARREPWQAKEPARVEVEIPDEIEVELGEYEVAPAIEALAGPHTFDPALVVLDLEKSTRGSSERGRLIALLVQHAAESAPYVCARFPGPLEARSEALAEATPIYEQGPVLAALAALGTVATPYLVPFLTDGDPENRRRAVRLLGHLADPVSFGALADRVFDADPRVASVARGELWGLRRHPELRPVAEKLRRALASPLAERAASAAQALGALRDVEAVAALVERLEAGGAVAEAAAEALWRITLQRLGPSPRRWLSWWRAHQETPRSGWLLAALTDEDRETRLAAAEELRAAGPPPEPYSADAPPAEREKAARVWATWWSEAGLTV